MQQLLSNYINSVHPVYSFIRPATVRKAVTGRFSAATETHQCDTIFYGIAALGALFSEEPAAAKERLYVGLAQSFQQRLDIDITHTTCPDAELVGALVLSTLYLRSTARPYATWMTSCTTMQTIIMMCRNLKDLALDETSQDSCCKPRQTFCIARLLNTWIANEFGRQPIRTLFDDLIIPPEPQEPVFARPDAQLIYLYLISDSLCLENEGNMDVFADSVTKIAAIDPQHCHDGVLLSRAVLAFCCHRLVRSNGTATLNNQTFRSLVNIGLDGLDAAKRLAQHQKPWWHLGNASFQFLCAMLMIDTSSSFAQVPVALQALENVARCLPSSSITEALRIAKKLVLLSRQQKTEQLQHLDQCMVSSQESSCLNHTTATLAGDDIHMQAMVPELTLLQQMPDVEGLGSFSGLDWSFFSSMDIPLFDLAVQDH